MSVIDNLEAMLDRGDDGALLRFALGNEYLNSSETEAAIRHLSVAVDLDADYSAAWKQLGKAQAEAGLDDQAAKSFERGIEAAERRGDQQAAKEMRVFLRRLNEKS
jgi:Tfp pilus assembly protein PilF